MGFLIEKYLDIAGLFALLSVFFMIFIVFDYRRKGILNSIKMGGLVFLGSIGISIFWLPFAIWWIRATQHTSGKVRT